MLRAQGYVRIVKHVSERMFICKRLFSQLELCCFCGKNNSCCSIVCFRDSAELQTSPATWAVCPSTQPTGKLWIGLSCSAGFSKTCQAVMLREQHQRLGFSRGHCFTSGQGCIDLRFIRSMLSTQVTGGSPHECQYPTSWACVTVTILSQKSGACYWCSCESLQIILPSHVLKNTGRLWNNKLRNKLWATKSGTQAEIAYNPKDPDPFSLNGK